MKAVKPLRRVAILGGTHGNETNGVFMVDGYRTPAGKRELQRPSISEVTVQLSNVGAIKEVVRFLDEDLNRQFGLEWLRDPERGTYEAQRTKVLNQQFGPKPGSFDPVKAPLPVENPDAPADNGAVDFCIDYHTTTSHMGCTLIVTGKDRVSLSASVYARAWLEHLGIPAKIFYIGMDRAEQPWAVSLGRHGVIVECGPSPWGCVRHDIVSWMRESTRRILDYIDARNRGVALEMPPAGSWGRGWAKGGGAGLPGRVVVNTAIMVRRGDDVAPMPAKIPVPTNEAGRAAVMFSPDVLDKDWRVVRKGDVLFVAFDGSETRYDGEFGDEVRVHFVNEAAYFLPSSGLGFELSQEVEMDLPPPPAVAQGSHL